MPEILSMIQVQNPSLDVVLKEILNAEDVPKGGGLRFYTRTLLYTGVPPSTTPIFPTPQLVRPRRMGISLLTTLKLLPPSIVHHC